MISRILKTACLTLYCAGALAAGKACDFTPLPPGEQKLGQWIDKSNWLNAENRSAGLLAGPVFMPASSLPPGSEVKRPATPSNSVDALMLTDPTDNRQRDIGFVLDSRLQAAGLLIMRNGQLLTERYRHGLQVDTPRLLRTATRPVLNLLGAIAIGQGKLSADKSVSRSIPALSSANALRKLSVQRLLEQGEAYDWSPAEKSEWLQNTGWSAPSAQGDIRRWLSTNGRWEQVSLNSLPQPAAEGNPEDELLAWLLSASYGQPLARIFCEQLLARHPPEQSILWLRDPQGNELASGLGMSLRDFAKLGQILLDARSSRSRIPNWFIEALSSSAGSRNSTIPGMSKGSSQRYGFVHLGGKANRIALIGNQGDSLYIDFDQRLIIALFANYPVNSSPLLLATLESLWQKLGSN